MPKYTPFWFFVLVLVCFHLFGYIGHYGYDDLYYAKLAKHLLDGQIDFYDHYSYRWTTLAYTALYFKIFGVNDLAIALSSLSISIASLFVSFLLLRDQKTPVIFFALSLQVLGSWYLFYTDKLTPDIYIILFSTLAVYFLVRQRCNRKNSGGLFNALGLSFALFLGFLSKETIVMLAPALLFFAIGDWVQKRNRIFWLSSFVFGSVLLAAYFYCIQRATGNAFARFSAIQANTYYNLCRYDVQDIIFTIRRISYEFIELFIQTGLAIPLAFLLSSISRKPFSFLKPASKRDFFITLSLLLLFAGNFMSTSLTAYSPICLDIRHFLFMMPILSVVAANAFSNYLDDETSNFSITRWLFVLCLASLWFKTEFTYTLYLPFTLVWLLHALYRKRFLNNYFLSALFITQLYPAYHWIDYAGGLKYERQKSDVKTVFNANPNDTFITDAVQRNLINFYMAFDSNQFNRVRTFDEIKDHSYRGKIIYKNWYTQYLSGLSDERLPVWMRLHSIAKTCIFKDSILGIEACRISDSLKTHTVFKNCFGYEQESPLWDMKNSALSPKQPLHGNFSEQLKDFSAIFMLPVDSLHLSGKGEFIIRASAQCKMKDKADLKLVIDMVADNKNLYWQATNAGPFMKAYGLWWPVTNEKILQQQDYVNKNTLLKIYFWMDKAHTEVQLDDWVIEVEEVEMGIER